jgi:mobilome CxxCx(11)CxxC protein
VTTNFSEIPIELQHRCLDAALQNFSTHFIFEDRARILKRRLTWLDGIAGLVVGGVGLVAISFGVNSPYWNYALPIASGLMIVQGLLSLTLATSWREEYAKTLKASKDNSRLFRRYRNLGRLHFTRNIEEFNRELAILDTESHYVSEQDHELGASSWEKRRGYRAALRELQQPCPKCQNIPDSADIPSECPACGAFQLPKFRF